VCRAKRFVVLFVSLLLSAPSSLASAPATLLPWKIVGSVSFGDESARTKFEQYVAMLESDAEKFAGELATLRQLDRSEIEYHVRLVDIAEPGVGGRLSTDGERVYVNVSADFTKDVGSLNSRFAHELEHARQFDNGELGFERDTATGAWRPAHSSYDIGDEVKAWRAQLNAASAADFWTTTNGRRRPSVLRLYSYARTDAERGDVLARNGYRERNPTTECNVVFETARGYVARQVIRPTAATNFFGRVFATTDVMAGTRDAAASSGDGAAIR
jgi:hypothetical protein